MIRHRTWLSLFAAALVAGCFPEIDLPESHLEDADVRVVFVGNSLTSTYSVPALVQAMANADGRSMAHAAITLSNASLEDHWFAGTPGTIEDLAPDVVVMQQGPSSLPANREHLIHWATQFAGVIQGVGGQPALYMIWPESARLSAFPAVYDSYQAAAAAAGGLFIPAGRTWVEAWELDESLSLYAPDGFHQTYLGSLAAAQTIYAVLFDVPPDSIPALPDDVPPAVVQLLRDAVAASLAFAGYDVE